MKAWLPLREEFLDEMLRFYGGEYPVDSEQVPCRVCGAAGAVFRCTACATRSLHCQQCMKTTHSHLPLHALEVSTTRV